MNAALIVMTILGCNDGGTDCHYIATAAERWPTVAMCDAVSEEHLPAYVSQPYPVLIAVCQVPEAAGVAQAAAQPSMPESNPAEHADTGQSAAGTATAQAVEEVTPQEAETLAGRAIQRVRNVLPTTEGVKTLMVKPVRLVEDGYSWVARRFEE